MIDQIISVLLVICGGFVLAGIVYDLIRANRR